MKFSKKRLVTATSIFAVAVLGSSLGIWWKNEFPISGKMYDFIYSFPKLNQVANRLMNAREGVIRRNQKRRTERLQLLGTVWKDNDTGAVLEFGVDGKMKWLKKPVISYPLNEDQAADPGAVEWIEGLKFRFDRRQDLVGYYDDFSWEIGSGGNLNVSAGANREAGVLLTHKGKLFFWAAIWDLPAAATDPQIRLLFDEKIK